MILPPDICLFSSFKNFPFRGLSYTKLLLLMDNNTQNYCYPLLQPYLPIHQKVVVPAGESHKTIDTCMYIWQKMMAYGLDRLSLLINLGGGVLCDMGGFCASSYLRGIAYIHMPTTLIAQVDASIGGKTGINFGGYKNQIGAFYTAQKVWIAPIFLKTLPHNILYSGFFEMIKHALIADEKYFNQLIHTPLQEACLSIAYITRSIQIKHVIVCKDFRESHERKMLNFGHTVGHALESYFLAKKKKITHGEAIAVGMICEAYIAYRKEILTYEVLHVVVKNIYIYIFHIKISLEEIDVLIQYMQQDKKRKKKVIYFPLIRGIGKGVIHRAVNQTLIASSLMYYRNIVS